MATFDVRSIENEEIEEIIFANKEDKAKYVQACALKPSKHLNEPYILIEDGLEGSVVVNSVEHAEHLIKALNKAIELGWLK